jgi:pyrroloquinoline quinone (PQQ) biosynthesis protein C
MMAKTHDLSRGELKQWLDEIKMELSDIPKKMAALKKREDDLEAEKVAVEKLYAEKD